jgi:hypothetical protein
MAIRRSDPTPAAGTGTSLPGKTSPRRPRAQIEPKTKVKAKGNSGAPVKSVTAEERLAMIAQAAYFNAEQRGFAPGGETEDWLRAEAEIDALLRAAHPGRAQ